MRSRGFTATLASLLVAAAAATASPRPVGPAVPAPTPAAPASPQRLVVEPQLSVLVGPRERQRLLVGGIDAQGRCRDLTAVARFVSLAPEVARVSAAGEVVPVADGTATIKAIVGGRTALAAVQVRAPKRNAPVSFNDEVVPLLTRAGCNQGACHGSQHGKGGFKLSLLGYDPDLDYVQIAKLARGRRLNRTEPERSLLLLKPSAMMPHGGGERLPVGSPDYQLLLQWIVGGAPGPREKDPRLVGLELLPDARVMAPGERQRLVVRARFSDGAAFDVTEHTRLNALNEGVAELTPAVEVLARAPGETAIMARYLGMAAVARITVPFHITASGTDGSSPPPTTLHPTPYTLPSYPRPTSFVDEWVIRKWRTLGLAPSGPCTDAEFIRRASLDAIGTLPTPAEVRAFVVSRAPDKRERLVDALLQRPEYADYWGVKWGDLLRINRAALGDKGMWSFYNWLHTCLQQNRPVDRWVRELITAQGSTYTTGPANFFRVASTPEDLAETTSQVFLGVRLQCARCHHHPFEKWSQNDYYQLAAYFARVGLKSSEEFGIFGGEQVVRLSATGEVNHPKTNAVMRPHPLDAPERDDPLDRRRALAAWLTAKRNPRFARNIVNRYWAYLMGRGIVEPVDDMRVTNPPTNPELLDALAADFTAHDYDLKALLRTIMTSQVYQLASQATPANRMDEFAFSHYRVKRLPAEVMLDAVCAVTGVPEKFSNLPQGTRAIQLPDSRVDSTFLDTFGRAPRQIACECERSAEPNIAQALNLMNGELVNAKVGNAEGRVAHLLAGHPLMADVVRELYLLAFARPPRPAELTTALRLVRGAPKPKEGVEDLLWTLLNSREFMFNH